MKNQRGSILVITLCFILAFTLMGFGSIYFAMMHNEAAEKRAASNKAFWLAEAGIQKALWKFKHNDHTDFYEYDLGVGGACNPTTPCTSFDDCGSKEKCFKSPSNDPLSTYGDYDIVMDVFNSTVKSTGSYPSRTATDLTQRKISLESNSDYKYAFYARDNIGTTSTPGIDNNSCTDGYVWPAVISNPGNCNNVGAIWTGRIGTLGTAGTVIKLLNVHIYGSVSTGPGGTVSNGGTIHVLPITNTNTGSLPSTTIPAALVSRSPDGTTITGSPGTDIIGVTGTNQDYKYTNISLGTNSTVTFRGTVRLYLTSTTSAIAVQPNFTFALDPGAKVTIYTGGKVNLTNNGEINSANDKKPGNFDIRSTRNVSDGGVQVANGGNFYGTVYAPDTDLTVGKNGGGTIFYGAMVGKTIHVNNNTPMHFEKGLAGSILDPNLKWSEF